MAAKSFGGHNLGVPALVGEGCIVEHGCTATDHMADKEGSVDGDDAKGGDGDGTVRMVVLVRMMTL